MIFEWVERKYNLKRISMICVKYFQRKQINDRIIAQW